MIILNMTKNQNQRTKTKITFWISLGSLIFIALLLNLREFISPKSSEKGAKKETINVLPIEDVENIEKADLELANENPIVKIGDEKEIKDSTVKDLTDFKAFLQKTKVTLVKFGASWCKYCKKIEQDFDSILTDKDFQILSLDRDHSPELFVHFGIESMPTFILFDRECKTLQTWRGSDKIQDVKKFVNDKKWEVHESYDLDLNKSNLNGGTEKLETGIKKTENVSKKEKEENEELTDIENNYNLFEKDLEDEDEDEEGMTD